jgi:hypothetical protein
LEIRSGAACHVGHQRINAGIDIGINTGNADAFDSCVAAASAVALAKEDTTAVKEEKARRKGGVKAAPLADGGWPRTLSFAGLSVKVFQPQLIAGMV